MEKENVSDLGEVKKLNTKDIGNDIRQWLEVDSNRTREGFAKNAGVSLRTLESILAYDGEGEEPNWRRTTLEGIMKALECDVYYTPKHEIK